MFSLFLVCNIGERPIAKPPTKEEKEKLSRKRDNIKLVSLRFENREIVRLRGRGRR